MSGKNTQLKNAQKFITKMFLSTSIQNIHDNNSSLRTLLLRQRGVEPNEKKNQSQMLKFDLPNNPIGLN